jgi:hypothetical protein
VDDAAAVGALLSTVDRVSSCAPLQWALAALLQRQVVDYVEAAGVEGGTGALLGACFAPPLARVHMTMPLGFPLNRLLKARAQCRASLNSTCTSRQASAGLVDTVWRSFPRHRCGKC